MAKSKSHKSDEELLGQIRELIKLNKSLRKRLRQLEKNKHIYNDLKLDYDELIEANNKQENIRGPIKCPKCLIGHLNSTDLGIRMLIICNSCLYRKTILNNKK